MDAALLKETSGKDSVVYKCVAEHDTKTMPFDAWTQRTTEVRRFHPLGRQLFQLSQRPARRSQFSLS